MLHTDIVDSKVKKLSLIDAEKFNPKADLEISIEVLEDCSWVLDNKSCLLVEKVNLKTSSNVSAFKFGHKAKKHQNIINQVLKKPNFVIFNTSIILNLF